MDKLAHGWHFTDCEAVVLYFGLGLLSQLVIRAFMSALSAVYLQRTRSPPKVRWPRLFGRCFTGFHPTDGIYRADSDYMLPIFLGLIEQYGYPIMMAVGAWTAIGAWLGFKTIVHWNRWSSDRFTFNRYLIGNALVVLSALMIVHCFNFIAIKPQPCADRAECYDVRPLPVAYR